MEAIKNVNSKICSPNPIFLQENHSKTLVVFVTSAFLYFKKYDNFLNEPR